jgi:hypothetical protein
MTSELQPEDLHRSFIDNVVANGTLWALRSDEGYAISPSNEFEEAEVMLFWSDAAQTEALASDEWADYKPEAISLPDFLDTWLLGMQQEDVLVGTNWDEELEGTELEPLELALVLSNRLLEQGKEIKLEHFDDLKAYNEQVKKALDLSSGA